jgi:uncharacterized membrane protein (DUF106 family)
MKSTESSKKGEYNFLTNTALILGLMIGITFGSAARLLYNTVANMVLPLDEAAESVVEPVE